MATEVWIYEGRNSATQAFWSFADARRAQDEENRATLQELLLNSPDCKLEWGGSEEEGWFYIDDGGSITKITVQGSPDRKLVEKPVLPPVDFTVGNPVRTTVDWAERFNSGQQIAGRVCMLSDIGHGLNEKRRVQVEFDEPPFWDFKKLYFAPDELELDV